MQIRRLLSAAACALGAALAPAPSATAQAPRTAGARPLIPVEQYRLANGLKVILHVDRSDPVVAVSLNAHVGSSREVPGRTASRTCSSTCSSSSRRTSGRAGSTG
jgi:zinc protease